MYENKSRVLCSNHNTLQLENMVIELHMKKLTVEKNKKTDLGQKIDQHKKNLQRVKSKKVGKVTSVKVVSSPAMETPGQHVEVRHSAEYPLQ
ncbi:hypothetical protein ABVT39_018357 [Epinephelus coioides]